jgi:hypothetical protein
MGVKPPRGSLLVGACLLLGALAPHAGAATLVASRPVRDPATHELALFVGGVEDDGRALRSRSIEVLLDGTPAEAVTAQPLSEWGAAAAEANAAWRPPLAIGLVYLWVDGVPAGVLEGLHAFFQRVPPRTTVLPTVYGRLRQGRARLAAADIGRLDEIPYLEPYRPNLLDAVALDLGDLAPEEAPLKILLVVTDGRDFADPKGEGPGDFGALGRKLRAAGVTPLVVGFPPRDPADAAQAAANLRDLHDAAGGFLRVLDQPDDLENTLESLGQALGDLRRVQVAEPLGWRLLGGRHRVSVRVAAGGGQLGAEVGTVSGAGGFLGIALLALAAVLVLAAAGFALVRARGRAAPSGGRQGDDDDGDDEADDDDKEDLVTAAHDLIRRGAAPARAVEELSRGRGSSVRGLVNLDPEILDDPRFPYFRTRPGRLRLKEIQDILSKKAAARPALGGTLAGILAEAIKSGAPPEATAANLAARVAAEDATAFAGLRLEELAQALKDAARQHTALGTPRARGAAVAIQDALRARGTASRGIAVAWLVRAGGPGRRGETLRLPAPRAVIGSATGAAVLLQGDPAISASHAEIVVSGGEFLIAPLEGEVSVEAKPVRGRHALADGDTITLGAAAFVFKSALSGTLPITDGGARTRS